MLALVKEVKGRVYDNAARQTQSAETRQRVLNAAHVPGAIEHPDVPLPFGDRPLQYPQGGLVSVIKYLAN